MGGVKSCGKKCPLAGKAVVISFVTSITIIKRSLRLAMTELCLQTIKFKCCVPGNDSNSFLG